MAESCQRPGRRIRVPSKAGTEVHLPIPMAPSDQHTCLDCLCIQGFCGFAGFVILEPEPYYPWFISAVGMKSDAGTHRQSHSHLVTLISQAGESQSISSSRNPTARTGVLISSLTDAATCTNCRDCSIASSKILMLMYYQCMPHTMQMPYPGVTSRHVAKSDLLMINHFGHNMCRRVGHG